jgi:hypothetical protein
VKRQVSRAVLQIQAHTVLAFMIITMLPLVARASDDVVVRILKMDAEVRTVNQQMFKTLDEVMNDACSRIKKLHKSGAGAWDPVYAESALKCIDDALVAHGFIYPDKGVVDLLADTLTPYQMTESRRPSFEGHPANERRLAAIAARYPGSFYVADCDTGCFIYLGVAERLSLPIHFIDLPGFDGHAGHNLVRWREGSHFIDWETTDGCTMPDDFYKSKWKVSPAQLKARAVLTDLTTEEVFGYEHLLVSIQFARRSEYGRAISALVTSLKMYPQDLLACNNYAWYIAVAPTLEKRDHQDAIRRVRFVLNLVNDPNVHDTLAAVYASAGNYGRAIVEEEIASKTKFPRYLDRLKQYRHHKPYREPKARPGRDEVFTR